MMKKQIHLFIAGALLLCACLTYASALRNPFLMDDHSFFRNARNDLKYFYHQLIPNKNQQLQIESGNTDRSYYRPFAHLLPLGCYALFGNRPTGYHVVNLLLLWLAALGLYIFLWRVFKRRLFAVLAAVFYVIHPINGVMVNYITASVYGLQVILMLLGLIFLWEMATRPRPRLAIPSVFFFALALLCHETSMAFALYGLVLLVTVGKVPFRESVGRMRWHWLLFGVYFLLRFRYASLNTSIFQNMASFDLSVPGFLASWTKGALWYLSKLVWPQGIVLIWGTPPVTAQVAGWLVVLAAVLGGATFLVVRSARGSALRLGLLWLGVGLVPYVFGSVISPLQGFIVEPHWFVVAGIGFFIIIADLVDRFLSGPRRTVNIALVALLVIAWTGQSLVYNHLWGSEKRYCLYWKDSVPGFKTPLYFLALTYEAEKDYERAKQYLRQCILYRYKDWMVYASLGGIELKQGHLDQALKEYQMALRLEPRSADVLNSAGNALMLKGDRARAATLFKAAVQANRFSFEARMNLIRLLVSDKKYADAITLLEENRRLFPEHILTQVGLVDLYSRTWQFAKALEIARGLARSSTDPALLMNVGLLFEQQGDAGSALAAYTRVLALDKKFKPVYWRMVKYYLKNREPRKAFDLLQQGMGLFPDDPAFEQALNRMNLSATQGMNQ